MKRLFKYTAILSLLFLFSCSEQMKNNLPINSSAEIEGLDDARQYLDDFYASHQNAPIFTGEMGNMKNKAGATLPSRSNDDILHYQEMIDAIDGSQYDCESTPLRDYVTEIREDWTATDYNFYGFSNLLWDYYYLYVNEEQKKEVYGISGEYTNQLNRTLTSNKKFWDVKFDVIMVGAHSTTFFSDLTLVTKMLNLYNLFGLLGPPLDANQIDGLASAIQTVFGSNNYWKYKHPLLSFNAFAALGEPASPWWPVVVRKIVMGDGISHAYDELGYGDVAPQAILAHEYAHHVQFSNNVPFYGTPESTRRTELMADALAAYYLTHKRGATMNWKRVSQFLEVFYNIGDCAFDNPGHHGTPNQRLRAAEWGYDLAKSQQKNGHISKSADVIEAFMQDINDIIED